MFAELWSCSFRFRQGRKGSRNFAIDLGGADFYAIDDRGNIVREKDAGE